MMKDGRWPVRKFLARRAALKAGIDAREAVVDTTNNPAAMGEGSIISVGDVSSTQTGGRDVDPGQAPPSKAHRTRKMGRRAAVPSAKLGGR